MRLVRYRTVEAIRQWAMRQADYLWKAFVNGRSAGFYNAETR